MHITKKAPLRRATKQKSLPEVFILESLSFNDEEEQRYEGKILCEILRMCGKTPRYYYFRTEAELLELVTLFRNSNYRYLHISCHGSTSTIHTTLGEISYLRFAEIFKNHLRNRRLFLSACSVGNKMLSTEIQKTNKKIDSIAAPADDIEFRHAAALWSALYVRLFSLDNDRMKSREIEFALTKICGLFGIRFFWSWRNPKNNRFPSKIIK